MHEDGICKILKGEEWDKWKHCKHEGCLWATTAESGYCCQNHKIGKDKVDGNQCKFVEMQQDTTTYKVEEKKCFNYFKNDDKNTGRCNMHHHEGGQREHEVRRIILPNPRDGLYYIQFLKTIQKLCRMTYVSIFFYFMPFFMLFMMRFESQEDSPGPKDISDDLKI